VPFVPPPADPRKLLAHWQEWERGEETPGRVLANLKTGGLADLLAGLVAGADEAASLGVSAPDA
jgi:hypothetical protein